MSRIEDEFKRQLLRERGAPHRLNVYERLYYEIAGVLEDIEESGGLADAVCVATLERVQNELLELK